MPGPSSATLAYGASTGPMSLITVPIFLRPPSKIWPPTSGRFSHLTVAPPPDVMPMTVPKISMIPSDGVWDGLWKAYI